jgi:hypothetical protein
MHSPTSTIENKILLIFVGIDDIRSNFEVEEKRL